MRPESAVTDLDHQEDVLGRVGDGKDGRSGQSGDGGRLDVRPQHAFGLLRVQVEEEVFRYLTQEGQFNSDEKRHFHKGLSASL